MTMLTDTTWIHPWRKEFAVLIRVTLLGLASLVGSLTAADGVIDGVVVNATRGDEISTGTDVVLRAHLNGQFVVVASTTTGPRWQFPF